MTALSFKQTPRKDMTVTELCEAMRPHISEADKPTFAMLEAAVTNRAEAWDVVQLLLQKMFDSAKADSPLKKLMSSVDIFQDYGPTPAAEPTPTDPTPAAEPTPSADPATSNWITNNPVTRWFRNNW